MVTRGCGCSVTLVDGVVADCPKHGPAPTPDGGAVLTEAEMLRGLARDPHARLVLSKAFREAPMANAAEALHALADGLDAGTILRPRTTRLAASDGLVAAAVERSLVSTIRYCQSMAVTARARGWNDRAWLDVIINLEAAPEKTLRALAGDQRTPDLGDDPDGDIEGADYPPFGWPLIPGTSSPQPGWQVKP